MSAWDRVANRLAEPASPQQPQSTHLSKRPKRYGWGARGVVGRGRSRTFEHYNVEDLTRPRATHAAALVRHRLGADALDCHGQVVYQAIGLVMEPAKPSSYVVVNGVTLAYSDAGAGPVVLYAHGLTTSRATEARRGLIDFAPVSSSRRLIAYDARGHGESTGMANPSHYTWPALADDMLALLDHVCPGAPCAAIGLSMGTGTLLHAALKQPHRFERLVLTAPPTAWETRKAQVAVYDQLARLAEQAGPDCQDVLAPQFTQTQVAPIFRDVPDYASLPDIPAGLIPSVFRGARLSDLPSADALRTLAQPTLVLAWDSDPGHPVSTAERLRALLPNSQLHVSTTSADLRSWGERAARFLSS